MKKILIITYYWPPSGGSGVQRWLFFSHFLPQYNIEPYVLTVDPKYASYKFIDSSFENKSDKIKVYRTKSCEPFAFYSAITRKTKRDAIPQGFSGESNPTLIQKMSRFVRGNFFIPDARVGWVSYAVKEAVKIIEKEKIDTIITTGPPHSTHLIGLKLKENTGVKWIADFRDPWTELYYNKLFYRTGLAKRKDSLLEMQVLEKADRVLTIGPSMLKLLQSKIKKSNTGESKFHFIYNGYDESIFNAASFQKDPDHFTLLHLGVLSDNQPIGGLIQALKEIKENNFECFQKLRLKLTGKISPAILSELRAAVPDLHLIVNDYVPHEAAIKEMINADLLLNSLAAVEDGKYLISGKLMEYLATGNPILCFGDKDGDAAKLLSTANDSVLFDRNDVSSIRNFILIRYEDWKNGKRNTTFNQLKAYTRFQTTQELAQLINKL